MAVCQGLRHSNIGKKAIAKAFSPAQIFWPTTLRKEGLTVFRRTAIAQCAVCFAVDFPKEPQIASSVSLRIQFRV